MKRALGTTCLAVLGAAALLAGTSPAPRAQDKITIGFSQGTLHSSWRVKMVEGNREYAEKNLPDVELIISNGEDSAAKQLADVESLMARGIDILLMSPVTAEALTPVVKQVMDAGTPVVTMDRKVNTDVTLHIGADNKLIGEAAAHFIGKTLGGQGNVIEIQGTAGASATVDRHEVFRAVLAEHYPGVKVIADQVCNYTREPALKFMETWSSGSARARSRSSTRTTTRWRRAGTALEAAGRLGEVQVVGIDGQETAYEAIKNGKMAATFTYTSSRRKACSTHTRSPRARRSQRRSCSRPSRSMPRTSTTSWAPAYEAAAAGRAWPAVRARHPRAPGRVLGVTALDAAPRPVLRAADAAASKQRIDQ